MLFDQAFTRSRWQKTFAIQVLIDGELGTPEAIRGAAGLFSYGWQVRSIPRRPRLTNVDVPGCPRLLRLCTWGEH